MENGQKNIKSPELVQAEKDCYDLITGGIYKQLKTLGAATEAELSRQISYADKLKHDAELLREENAKLKDRSLDKFLSALSKPLAAMLCSCEDGGAELAGMLAGVFSEAGIVMLYSPIGGAVRKNDSYNATDYMTETKGATAENAGKVARCVAVGFVTAAGEHLVSELTFVYPAGRERSDEIADRSAESEKPSTPPAEDKKERSGGENYPFVTGKDFKISKSWGGGPEIKILSEGFSEFFAPESGKEAIFVRGKSIKLGKTQDIRGGRTFLHQVFTDAPQEAVFDRFEIAEEEDGILIFKAQAKNGRIYRRALALLVEGDAR